MTSSANERGEILLTPHREHQWQRRIEELQHWMQADKPRKRGKRIVQLGEEWVDWELYPALQLLNDKGIATEFSCAGVSCADEPHDHSLYAYLTIPYSVKAEAFIRHVIRRMRHRICVTYEPLRHRYDLSSMRIQQNRSFCLLLHACARDFDDKKVLTKEV